jgi:hypothetical protein
VYAVTSRTHFAHFIDFSFSPSACFNEAVRRLHVLVLSGIVTDTISA